MAEEASAKVKEQVRLILNKLLPEKKCNVQGASSSDTDNNNQNAAETTENSDEKKEEKDNGGTSPSRNSPDPNCAICLEPLQNKSFTDSCFHTFCFTCLVEWSKIKAECPLCKQQFKSIVHNVQNDMTFEEYHITSKNTCGWPFLRSNLRPRRTYHVTDLLSTTLESRRHLSPFTITRISDTFQNQMASHRMLFAPHAMSMYADTQRPPRTPCHFRRRVYNENLWIRARAGGRSRLVSPEFFKRNPACTHRLLPWLNRELVVLLENNDSQISFVLELIMSLVARFGILSEEFHIHLEPYMGSRTRHFIHELYSFATSPYDMENHDRHADYGINNDVIIVDEEDVEIPWDCHPAGPGTAGGNTAMPPADPRRLNPLILKRKSNNIWERIFPFNLSGLPPYYDSPLPSTSSGFVRTDETTQTGGSDNEDCRIVDVLKPKRERTPVVVDISSEEEATPAPVIDVSSSDDVPPDVAPNVEGASVDRSGAGTSVDKSADSSSDIECVYEGKGMSRYEDDRKRSPFYPRSRRRSIKEEKKPDLITDNSTSWTFVHDAVSNAWVPRPQVIPAYDSSDDFSFSPARDSRSSTPPPSAREIVKLEDPSSDSWTYVHSAASNAWLPRSQFPRPYETSEDVSSATSEDESGPSKKLKLRSVVAHFSYDKADDRNPARRSTSPDPPPSKKRKEKKKKKKKHSRREGEKKKQDSGSKRSHHHKKRSHPDTESD